MEITKWEYKTIDASDLDRANKLGKLGWEAFAYNPNAGKILLKRPCGRLKVIEKVNGVEINNTETERDNSNGYER